VVFHVSDGSTVSDVTRTPTPARGVVGLPLLHGPSATLQPTLPLM
jgi:hypothetical protein